MKIRKEFIVGIVAAMGITLLILGFFYLQGRELWKQSTHYYAIFSRTDGISNGNMVNVNGYPIGVVSDVSIYKHEPLLFAVKFELTEEDFKIPVKSKAVLSSSLMGGAFIDIQMAKTGEYHQNGDTLISDEAEALEATIEKRLGPLELKVQELLGTTDSAITIISTIFANNTGNLNQSFEALNRSINNFESITKNLDSLMYTMEANKYKLTATMGNIESITANLKKSNEEISKIITNSSKITDSLAAIDLNGIVDRTQLALDQVNMILDDVQNGDGTLTQLMQDSLLYDNMNLMIEEATRLVENIKEHPNRYLQFAVFGSKDKGINLDSRDEKILRKYVKDTLRPTYNQ